MSSRKLLVFFFCFLLYYSKNPPFVLSLPSSSSSDNVRLDFPFFSLRNFTLLGDSYLRNGMIGLTRELGVPSSSAGTVIFNNPIKFFDSETNTTASFSTKFSFTIANLNPSSFGDGLSFFLSPDNRILGSPGGYLGLVNSSQLTKNKFLAIEFDTRLDMHFDDPNDNHVGFDIESLNSIKTANTMLQGINLKAGNVITTWIDYKNVQEKLSVFLSYSNIKPEKAILSLDINLYEYLTENMYVGFSASTEGSTELHLIENWSFHTYGFLSLRTRKNPHNVSDNSVAFVTPMIPEVDSDSSSRNNHHKKLGLELGIAVPAFFFVALVVFVYVSVRRLNSIKTQKLFFNHELLTSPREFTYRELKLATKGFHSSRIIGHGAFGTVYKAFFVNSGTIAAVKRSKHSHEGTMGYLAPEYLQYGKATEKTDVFSFGVVILEVACGRRPIEREIDTQKMVNLVDWVWGLYSEGKIIEAADKRLNGEFKEEEMRKLLLVGLSCANPDSNERPTMRRVLQILSNEAEPMEVPRIKPSLTFSCSLHYTLDDIVSDDDDDDQVEDCEIKVTTQQ
ncbi:probable L-type lectin-domain containing receptor kinase S.7 isoform X2 [Cannabis sativa]|uniref:probable L-type lectin-domain containing receptor kinase S.7 isoform X2 n=1 Tax=Cannabis sativa TaxID=3483 RepID=UPI0029CA6C1E|nr:probable L-type lectin-domain containing receptor kinase S.7 isoform X2 [Cannabis sativa]